jgi:hypothetical protein
MRKTTCTSLRGSLPDADERERIMEIARRLMR